MEATAALAQQQRKRSRWSHAWRPLLAVLVVVSGGWAVPARADGAAGLGYFRNGQFSEAFQAWRTEAERGDAASALYLGVLYDTGIGVPQDYAQALDWYKRGGASGNPTAMFNAAVMYDVGRGTEPNPAAAIDWYGRAAKTGYARADYALGLVYEDGIGVPRDRALAIRYYRDAAKRGISAARGHLAALGRPFAGRAATVVEDPAMASFETAQRLLLSRGTADAARAVALFRQAANRGNALAAYNLAYCYEHGLGIPRSLEQALAWYRRSAAEAKDEPIKLIAETGARNLVASVSHAQR